MYTITIPGKPQSQPRPRWDKRGFMYDPSSALKRKMIPGILDQFQAQCFQPSDHYHVTIILYMTPPSKWRKGEKAAAEGNYASETTKDLDNCAKFYNDLLPFNDSFITRLVIEKRYSSDPKTVIIVEPIKQSSLSP